MVLNGEVTYKIVFLQEVYLLFQKHGNILHQEIKITIKLRI